MKALVLCIDRDDDIGEKTGIKGPIVGREDNLRAAQRLALADPEDADVNTMFSAIATFDQLVQRGTHAEMATICGSKHVGPESDRILTEQLDEVLEEVNPHYTYLVSDGAEDEFIFPIISSRIKVNHVKRVAVKQNATVENWVYVIIKAMKDERVKRKIFTPLIIMLLAYGIVGFLVPFYYYMSRGSDLLYIVPWYILPIIALVIGIYFLFWTFPITRTASRVSKGVIDVYKNSKKALMLHDYSVAFTVIGMVLIVIGLFVGMDAAVKRAQNSVEYVFFFIGSAFLWIVLGVMTHEGGKVVKAFRSGVRIKPSFWIVTLGVFGALIVFALLFLVAFNLVGFLFSLTSWETALMLIVFAITMSLIVLIGGAVMHRRLAEKVAQEDAWRR